MKAEVPINPEEEPINPQPSSEKKEQKSESLNEESTVGASSSMPNDAESDLRTSEGSFVNQGSFVNSLVA